MKKIGMFILLALLITGCICKAGFSDDIVWVSLLDSSLWKGSLNPSMEPVKLYGHGVDSMNLTPSPDGYYVASGLDGIIYDIEHPGLRHTVNPNSSIWFFIGAWAPDGKGLLMAKSATNQEGTYLGTYAVDRTGCSKLIALPPSKYLPGASGAVYSPDKHLLAIKGDMWIHIINASNGKTVMFRAGESTRSATSIRWIDNNRLVGIGINELGQNDILLVDIGKKSIKTLFSYHNISSIAYSKSRGVLYAVMNKALYVINLANINRDKVEIHHMTGIQQIFGVTDDGKTAVLLADAEADTKNRGRDTYGIWAVNLATKKYSLIARGPCYAAIIPLDHTPY